MRPSHRIRRALARLGVALMLASGSCSFFTGEDTTTTTAPPQPTTTTTTTIPFPPRSTTSTTLSPGVDADVAAQLQAQIAELLVQAEAIRGLQFVEEPPIVIVSDVDFERRLSLLIATELDPAELDVDQSLLELLGMLDADEDLAILLGDAYDASYAAFYDTATTELVLSGASASLTAVQRTAIFHELVHALTDQYFATDEKLDELLAGDHTDAATALQALIEGDATYFQFLYLEGLTPTERAEVATDLGVVAGDPVVDGPEWLLADLAFPYDTGLDFVNQLVSGGGIAALDRAYLDPPLSTEHVLHPERYRIGEALRPVPDLLVSLDGYDTVEEGTFGEWRLRLLLSETLQPGILTQTTDGWGADRFAVLESGSDLAFVLTYAADSEDDAIEVALALVEHTRVAMGAGNGVEVDGGILFDEGGPWVYIDRIGDGLVYIVASDPAAGRALRPQVRVP